MDVRGRLDDLRLPSITFERGGLTEVCDKDVDLVDRFWQQEFVAAAQDQTADAVLLNDAPDELLIPARFTRMPTCARASSHVPTACVDRSTTVSRSATSARCCCHHRGLSIAA